MNIKNINNLFAGLLRLLTTDLNAACQNQQNSGELKSGSVKHPEVINFDKMKTFQINERFTETLWNEKFGQAFVVPFKDSKLISSDYENLTTGWLPNNTGSEVRGRPIQLLVNADGSLLMCDDGGDKIWRLSY